MVSLLNGIPVDHRLLNRELSWLDFNERVLRLATEPGIPLLERLKFCAIFSSNLDEFFQVRVAAMKDQEAAGITSLLPDGLTPAQQLAQVLERVQELCQRQQRLLFDVLLPQLKREGVELCEWHELSESEVAYLKDFYDHRIFPILTPLAVDPAHPFPYVSNLAFSVATIVRDPATLEQRFARVKVPTLFPRLLALPGGSRFIPVESVIIEFLATLFPGMEIDEATIFRVTRNADLALEDEDAEDLLQAVEVELRKRRYGRAVRLEIDHRSSTKMRELLIAEHDLSEKDVVAVDGLLDPACLWQMHAVDRSDLKDDQWQPVTAGRLAAAAESGRSIFAVVRERALLLHHPYESFASSVEEFVAQAAVDPRVQSIKMTLYRTSGDSPIAQHLILAAERGVQVAVLVELKARFDEARNMSWAKELEYAGVHVTYGLVGLKTHAKCILVVRNDPDKMRRYVHMGTGNYHPSTAKIYTDLSLLTCRDALTSELAETFNCLTGVSRFPMMKELMVAPWRLCEGFHELIENEIGHAMAGRPCGIYAKVNSLVEEGIIEALYRASAAGVPIRLLVRGMCAVRVGIPGVSENIEVRSLVGRFLEHSRIYRFENGGDVRIYLGSSDWMPRNLFRRVETVFPITAPGMIQHVDEILSWFWKDNVKSQVMQPDGVYRFRDLALGEERFDAQMEFLADALRRRKKVVPVKEW